MTSIKLRNNQKTHSTSSVQKYWITYTTLNYVNIVFLTLYVLYLLDNDSTKSWPVFKGKIPKYHITVKPIFFLKMALSLYFLYYKSNPSFRENSGNASFIDIQLGTVQYSTIFLHSIRSQS